MSFTLSPFLMLELKQQRIRYLALPQNPYPRIMLNDNQNINKSSRKYLGLLPFVSRSGVLERFSSDLLRIDCRSAADCRVSSSLLISGDSPLLSSTELGHRSGK
jgi:hypothetical protein